MHIGRVKKDYDMPNHFIKDPDAKLDYKFDWSEWLQTAETIVTYTMTSTTGITQVSSSNDDDSVTVWFSGGTVGAEYGAGCKITTNSTPARIDERTITLYVAER